MRALISTTIVEQVAENKTACVREVRIFGWLVKHEEVYSEGIGHGKTIGFNVLPDQREYVEDEE